MTDRELMQQALEALEEIADEVFSPYGSKLGGVILALRERLAQPQRTHWEGCEEVHPECKRPATREEKIINPGVYEVPVAFRREWVGLTEEDMVMCESEEDVRFVRAIEAKLKEKNNG